jgi:hypothetical protein
VLETANHCGAALDTVTFVVGDPGAAFTHGSTSGCAPLTVSFQNQSPFGADSVLWHLPGSSLPFTNAGSPVAGYSASGTYSATLIAYIAGVADTVTQQLFIEVLADECPSPQIFSQSDGLSITAWTDCPAGSFLWDLGDGTTQAGQSVEHTYGTTGVYPVSLTVTGQCGGGYMASALVEVDGVSATGGGRQGAGAFAVFPNPASGQVFFASKNQLGGEVMIRLRTATGLVVAELEKGQWGGTAAMPLDGMPTGLYFYEIQVDGREAQQGKLVVVR